MADWKKEIRRLASDFEMSRNDILAVFRKIEGLYAEREVPSFYKGNRNNFLYDKAQSEIMNRVYA